MKKQFCQGLVAQPCNTSGYSTGTKHSSTATAVAAQKSATEAFKWVFIIQFTDVLYYLCFAFLGDI